ncbi:hypothetical protein DRZ78_03225, partial [Candidatus Aerophobetes bacterium]
MGILFTITIGIQFTISNGLPLSYYVDEHSIFRFVNHKGIHVTYTVGEDEGKVQFKRALESINIGVIYAQSSEAKGKIEK